MEFFLLPTLPVPAWLLLPTELGGLAPLGLRLGVLGSALLSLGDESSDLIELLLLLDCLLCVVDVPLLLLLPLVLGLAASDITVAIVTGILKELLFTLRISLSTGPFDHKSFSLH